MVRKVGVFVLMLALSATAARAGDKDPTTNVKVRFVSLAECRAIALRQGSIGQPSVLFPGIGLDCLVSQPADGHAPVKYQVWAYSAVDDPQQLVLVCQETGKSLLEFERSLQQMLLNVETAYWNLYGSYGNLYSRSQAQRFAFEAYSTVKTQFEAGSKNVGELAQARGQYELFRAQRLAAIDTVLDNERQLRALMGMPAEDDCRLVPCDAPTLHGQEPDLKDALYEASANRPELKLARRDVQAAQLKLFLPTWPILEVLSRGSSLQLARSFAVLQDQELKAERFLGLQYRRIHSYQAQIQAQRAQREAYAAQLKARHQEFLAERKTLDILLESQRFWADALANEYAAITSYNNALCGFQYAKGSILTHAHVVLADAAPEGATTEAVDRECQRTKQRMKSRSGLEGLSFLDNAPSPKAVQNLFADSPQLDTSSKFGLGVIR